MSTILYDLLNAQTHPTRKCRICSSIALVTLLLGAGATDHTSDDSHFAVAITGIDSPVVAGESLVVTANVRNTGTEEDSQQIHLKTADEQIVDSRSGPLLTLTPDEQETVALRWNTTTADVGTDSIRVQSDDAYPAANVTITPAPTLTSDLGASNTTLVVGDTLTVSVNVTNTDNVSATPAVWMALNSSQTAETTTDVASGTTECVTFNYTTTEDDVGTWNPTAGIDSDQESRQVTVTNPEPTTADSRNSTESSSSGSPPNILDRMYASISGPGMATFADGDVRKVHFADEVDDGVVTTRARSQLESPTYPPPLSTTPSYHPRQQPSVMPRFNSDCQIRRWNRNQTERRKLHHGMGQTGLTSKQTRYSKATMSSSKQRLQGSHRSR